jgi:hypothetical protein
LCGHGTSGNEQDEHQTVADGTHVNPSTSWSWYECCYNIGAKDTTPKQRPARQG